MSEEGAGRRKEISENPEKVRRKGELGNSNVKMKCRGKVFPDPYHVHNASWVPSAFWPLS